MFVDEVSIIVQGGKGGDGCQSFRYTSSRKKKPNGGDGGKGGDVVIIPSSDISSLIDFKYHRHLKAQPGYRGSSNNKTGRSGEDLFIKVPLGTVVRDKSTGEILGDLISQDDRLIVARGGRPGRGNNNAPLAQRGEEGQKREIVLELKSLADAGIVGLPNAGKSTLINALCGTKSVVAQFPFTTQHPVLGVRYYRSLRITFADIPGIIEDASKGRGLGLRFLRHIERTRIIIFLLDTSLCQRYRLREQLKILKTELKNYKEELLDRPYIIAINKMDLEGAEEMSKDFVKRIKEDIIFISALKKKGLNRLLSKVYKLLLHKKSIQGG